MIKDLHSENSTSSFTQRIYNRLYQQYKVTGIAEHKKGTFPSTPLDIVFGKDSVNATLVLASVDPKQRITEVTGGIFAEMLQNT